MFNIAFGALCCVVLKKHTTIYHAIIITVNNSLKCIYFTTFAISSIMQTEVIQDVGLSMQDILRGMFRISSYLHLGYAFHRYVIVCDPEKLKKLNNFWCALLYVVVLVTFQYGFDRFMELSSLENFSTLDLAFFVTIAVRHIFAIAASLCHAIVVRLMKKRYDNSVNLLQRLTATESIKKRISNIHGMVKFDACTLQVQVVLLLTNLFFESGFLVVAHACDIAMVSHVEGAIILIHPIVEFACSTAYIVSHIKFVPSFNRTVRAVLKCCFHAIEDRQSA